MWLLGSLLHPSHPEIEDSPYNNLTVFLRCVSELRIAGVLVNCFIVSTRSCAPLGAQGTAKAEIPPQHPAFASGQQHQLWVETYRWAVVRAFRDGHRGPLSTERVPSRPLTALLRCSMLRAALNFRHAMPMKANKKRLLICDAMFVFTSCMAGSRLFPICCIMGGDNFKLMRYSWAIRRVINHHRVILVGDLFPIK